MNKIDGDNFKIEKNTVLLFEIDGQVIPSSRFVPLVFHIPKEFHVYTYKRT